MGVTPDDQQAFAQRRAASADQLMRNPMLVEAFEALDKHWMNGWRNTLPSQSAERDEIYHRLSALKKVWQELQSYMNEGKIVEETLKRSAQAQVFEDLDGSAPLDPGIV